MGYMGQDEILKILENAIHRLAGLGALGRQGVDQGPGDHAGRNSVALRVRSVVGDPVNNLIAEAAKLLGRHVAERRRWRRVHALSRVALRPSPVERREGRREAGQSIAGGI